MTMAGELAIPEPQNASTRPRAGAIPKPGDNMELLSKAERDRRKRIGPKTRLTQQVTDDVTTALGTCGLLSFAADYVGIDRKILGTWLREGERASHVKWSERTQFERRCVIFREAVREAMGQFGLRVVSVQAQAAGMTKERPTITTTRRHITAARLTAEGKIEGGTEADIVIETRELAPDWRAAVQLGKTVFPDELGDPEPEEDPEAAGSVVTSAMLKERIEALRRERAERDEEAAAVIDAEVVETENQDEGDPTR
jgi:hypothetical protein